MEDQALSLPQGSNDLLVQVVDYPARPTAESETPNLWNARLLDSQWWQYLADVSSQETLSFVSDAIDHGTVWPPSVNEPTARSPILSQSRNPETLPPLTFVPGNFDGSFGHSFGNQAGEIPDLHTDSGYNEHIAIQEADIQLTRGELLERGIDSPSTRGNAQIYLPRNADTFSSDVCPNQLPQQQWEELKDARQYPDPGSSWSSGNRTKAFRGVHRCAACSKAYRRPQDLKRHIRDKHDRQRECPFCCVKWTRPERIRAHVMKKHRVCLTEDEEQEIRFLQGRHDTIGFLEKYRKMTHSGTLTPDQLGNLSSPRSISGEYWHCEH